MGSQQSPPLANLNFNAHHSPIGAFMSFTCGRFDSGGGIGVEIGRPASQNIFIGVKQGDRLAPTPLRCLPFFKDNAASPTAAAMNFTLQGTNPVAKFSIESYSAEQIIRSYAWATDSWQTPDFTFRIHTPFGSIPQPDADIETLRAALVPAIVATLEVDNRGGNQTKTAVFALDFIEPGARILPRESGALAPGAVGFAWKRSMGVLGAIESDHHDDSARLFALQRWSVAQGVADVNPVHSLGTCAGLAMEVAPGTKQTLVLAIGVYLDAIVTTDLEGRYFYTRLFSSLDDVLSSALRRSTEIRTASVALDAQLLDSGLSADQQFLIAHATRGYYGNTQLLDVAGEPFWIVNEGEYCMMNTLDLAVDQAFWELEHNPWVVLNILTNFARRYSYHDQVKTRGGELLPGGISFCHDMGINNNFSPPEQSSYELPHLHGCFSHMTQEQLCNWVLTAACYVVKTRDTPWLLANSHLLDACAQSMRARANPRTGVMTYDSARCGQGQEITTYDSLDESLGQARASTYLAAKCWATWVALDLLGRLRNQGDPSAEPTPGLADDLARTLVNAAQDQIIPAVLETENPAYHSRVLPLIEALVYPAYWLAQLAAWPAEMAADAPDALRSRLRGRFIDALRQHTLALLTDAQGRNRFPDGGIKLSSTSDNSWMSKIALVQHVAREVLQLEDLDPSIASIMRAADAAHVRWQTDGAGHWACCDQFVNGEAKGSRYYPRIITTALWLDPTFRWAMSQVTPQRPGRFVAPR
jgi:hypothetical protein